jgi:hypothetical protein
MEHITTDADAVDICSGPQTRVGLQKSERTVMET